MNLIDSTPSKDAQEAVLRMLRATLILPAQVTFYGAALAAIALAGGAVLPPALVAIAAGVGVNALSSILDRVARGQASDEEIREQVQQAIAESGIAELVERQDAEPILARMFRRLDILEYTLQKQDFVILDRLTQASEHHQAFAQEMLNELATKMETLATREQGAQILARLEQMEAKERSRALSVIPKSERLLRNLPLIGRENDFRWLSGMEGDKLLLGQPGSGKTFLLQQLTKETSAFFVNSGDIVAIANEIVLKNPSILIVDDARLNRQLLIELKQLREQLKKSFIIVVSGWPSDKRLLADALNLPLSHIRELELLTQNEIVSVIRSTGIEGPIQLIRELVDQAEGRPGLAVTLADLCLKGDVRNVAFGDAISHSLLKYLDSSIGERATIILGAFAVGGGLGMEKRIVANQLGLSSLELQEILTHLAAGGIILENGRGRLEVRPPALRAVLVKEVFFNTSTVLDIGTFLRQAPRLKYAILVLIEAKRRGALIDMDYLQGFVEEANDPEVWLEYASLGATQTKWILSGHPDQVVSIAGAALHYAPQLALPLLFRQAINDNRSLSTFTDHPLRLVQDWVQSSDPRSTQATELRQKTLDASQTWLSENNDVSVGVHALSIVFSPRFEDGFSNPGDENTFTMRRGIVSADDLKAITLMWPNALGVLKQITIEDWQYLRQLVNAWVYPEQMGVSLPDSTVNLMQSFARQILADLLPIAKGRLDVIHWINQFYKPLGLETDLPLDSDFETLYPVRESNNWKEDRAQQQASVEGLVAQWVTLEPATISKRLREIESAAQRGQIHGSNWTNYLCAQLADQVSSPIQWAEAMIREGNSSSLALPFLEKASSINEAGWTDLASFHPKTLLV